MDKLQQARDAINQLDKQMAELFCRRMEAVRIVAEYKRENHLPVYDPERERAVIERNSAMVTDPGMRTYYIDFIENTMRISRQYQHWLLDGQTAMEDRAE